ncbi:hypothetical protein KUTG_07393 [Kutzneria sp. 744]|nr:hypothetical protein KUTG_07393 [Kutzneria sp. 744]
MRYEFDREWDHVMEEARLNHSLVGVHDLLAKWRLFAYAELKDPGSYYRILAKAEVVLRTGEAPAGSISGEEMKAIIQQRLADAPPRVTPSDTPNVGLEQN